MRIDREQVVTPLIALRWLERNHPDNRNKKDNKIKAYARDIKAGSWKYPTGELIKFDDKGYLVDGQNRLHAVVLAETPATFDVAWDVPNGNAKVLDSGAARSFADALSWHGTKNRNNVGGVVRWVLAWEQGLRRGTGGRFAPTHSELMARYEKDFGLFDASTSRGLDLYRAVNTAGKAGGVGYFLMAGLDEVSAKDFFDPLVSGEKLDRDSPILTLRNRLIRGRKIQRDTPAEQLSLLVRGWNAWREDRPLGNIAAFGRMGLTNENFPRPK